MTFVFTRALDALLGRGDSAITVPALDGALRPNRRLDEAQERISISAPGGIVVGPDGITVSSGGELRLLESGGQTRVLYRASAEISSMAAIGDGIALGLEDGRIAIFGGKFDGAEFPALDGARCPTAMVEADGCLYIAHGSAQNSPSDWQRDLMERNTSGSIWRLNLADSSRQRIADRLAYPAGIAINGDSLVVSESWKHRVIQLDKQTGEVQRILQHDLPGYPGHLGPGPGKGFVMTMFAPRNQLVEFILREHQYRRRMISDIDPRYWVAPKLRSGRSFYEPLQGGGVKHLGILKPWAPTLSFGMVALMDENGLPYESFQSRADGATHGITGAVIHDNSLYAVSKGDDVVVRLALGF